MNKYELMFLCESNDTATKAKADKLFKKVSEFLKSHKAVDLNEAFWGERELAYSINKAQKAFYYLFTFSLDSKKVVEIQKFLNLEENIIRSLLTKKD